MFEAQNLLLVATIAVGVTMFAFAVYVGNGVVRARQTAAKRLVGLQTRSEILESGFSERALAPVVERVGRLAVRLTPQGWVNRAQQKLTYAGWADRMDGNTWAAIRLISAVAAFLVWTLLFNEPPLGLGVFQDPSTFMYVASLGFLLAVGFFGPEAVINRKIDQRRNSMERELPDVIDLLVISVEAGLGFESALGRVVQNVPGELSREFSRMLQETRVGVSRHTAMKNLAERTDVDDLDSFILAMNQADQFGVSIGRMLRVQADEMRVRRRQRAQERAFAAPVKMVFPLVLCIFPAIFVVLLGPAVIRIAEVFL